MIDGLQRISTILEFMGKLRIPGGGLKDLESPSILDATKYLHSLHNAVWTLSDKIGDVPIEDQVELDKTQQLAIRRARIGVEILKRPSDDQTKFDLFQRLNAGGTQANAQELRNCIMLMVNKDFFRTVKTVAERESFIEVIDLSQEQIEKQRHMELAVRFLVHANVPYDGTLDVEEYIDEGIIHIFSTSDLNSVVSIMVQTFDLLHTLAGKNALRRWDGDRHTGKVGLVGLEGIAVGIGKNLPAIMSLEDPTDFVQHRIRDFWNQPEIAGYTSPGLRGTTRIQRTVPFGVRWFRP